MNTTDLKSFHYLENGDVSFSMLDTIKTQKILDLGSYKLDYLAYPQDRIELKLHNDLETTKIHNFPSYETLNNVFNSFFNETISNNIRRLGFYHKIGILLYGKEGTGKTTIMKYYCNNIIKNHNALVFYINPSRISSIWQFIVNIRAIQNNPIIVVMDEFDSCFNENSKENTVKNILDGNSSIDNVIFLASTNYINRIPDSIKNRPSRFKYVINIESIQSEEDIYNIIKGMLDGLLSDKEIKLHANELKGSSLDMIKQFCIDKIMDLKTYDNPVKTKKVGFSILTNN